MLLRKKKLSLLCPEKKYFGSQTVQKKKKKKPKKTNKFSSFLSDENKNKILRNPPPHPRKSIKWSVPKLSEWGWALEFSLCGGGL